MNFYNKYYRFAPAAISFKLKPVDALPGILVWIIPALLFLASCKKPETIVDEVIPVPVLGTCTAVTPAGGLQNSEEGKYSYRTSGGGTILIQGINNILFHHDKYPNFKYELWGDVTVSGQVKLAAFRENLNGKHIKDRNGNRRTIIFPDGTKFTLIAGGEKQQVLSISIYDGLSSHHINIVCGKIEHSMTNSSSLAKEMDEAEADGETSTFEILYDWGVGNGTSGLNFYNIYREDVPGNKQMNKQMLGTLHAENPTQVNDYYDDPRLGHT